MPDDLRPIAAFSVLADPDRQIVHMAQVWIRRVCLQSRSVPDLIGGAEGGTLPGMGLPSCSYTFRFDGVERDALFELSEKLTELLTRTSEEPQLFRSDYNTGGSGGA